MDERPIDLTELRREEPPEDLWPAIRGEFDRRRGRRRVSVLTAIAAVLAIALVVVMQTAPPNADPVVAPAITELAALQARSAELSSGLTDRHHGVVDGAALELLVWLEFELGWLDQQITVSPGDVALWRERVELLEEMDRRYSEQAWQQPVVLVGI